MSFHLGKDGGREDLYRYILNNIGDITNLSDIADGRIAGAELDEISYKKEGGYLLSRRKNLSVRSAARLKKGLTDAILGQINASKTSKGLCDDEGDTCVSIVRAFVDKYFKKEAREIANVIEDVRDGEMPDLVEEVIANIISATTRRQPQDTVNIDDIVAKLKTQQERNHGRYIDGDEIGYYLYDIGAGKGLDKYRNFMRDKLRSLGRKTIDDINGREYGDPVLVKMATEYETLFLKTHRSSMEADKYNEFVSKLYEAILQKFVLYYPVIGEYYRVASGKTRKQIEREHKDSISEMVDNISTNDGDMSVVAREITDGKREDINKKIAIEIKGKISEAKR